MNRRSYIALRSSGGRVKMVMGGLVDFMIGSLNDVKTEIRDSRESYKKTCLQHKE